MNPYGYGNTVSASQLLYEKDDVYSFKTIGLNLGGEINRAINSSFYLNFGVRTTILPIYFLKILGGGEGGGELTFDGQLEEAHIGRISSNQIFSAKIGIGILLP